MSTLLPADQICISSENLEERNQSDKNGFISQPSNTSVRAPLVQQQKRIKVYPPRETRIRAKKPKTRTGCKTCKIRRVKCGEEKPSCTRCIKFGAKCDGYGDLPAPPPKQKSLQPLLPKGGASILISPVTALFENENEYQYFMFFRDEVALDLSGPTRADVWNLVVLRSSTEEPAIRYLAVAVAAVKKYQATSDNLEISNRHRRFAMQQYARALKRIQTVLNTQRQEDGIRISLLASLLIFCFENVLGEHEQAIRQIKSALNLMERRLSTSKTKYSLIRMSNPSPDLEEEVLHAFIRLDYTVMARFGEPQTQPKTSRLHLNYAFDSLRMPRIFADVVEAKNYLEHLQFRAMPILSHMPDYIAYGNKCAPKFDDELYQQLAWTTKEWSAAFAPLMARASNAGYHEFQAAASVRVMEHITSISLRRVYYGHNPIPPDAFSPECSDIISLSRRVVSDPRFRKTFVMDCGVVPSLFATIMLCQDRGMREEAIEILRLAGERMEVVWSAKAIADFGERVLKAEDERERAAMINQDLVSTSA